MTTREQQTPLMSSLHRNPWKRGEKFSNNSSRSLVTNADDSLSARSGTSSNRYPRNWMTSFKCLLWTRLLYVLLFSHIKIVSSRCTKGYELDCIWTHDEKSPLKWVTETEDGQTFVRLTGCPNGQCGIAVMQSPWLDPRPTATVLKLRYKLYGTSSVYLRLYSKSDDEVGQYTIFSKEGNYKFHFPKEWSTKEIVIPAIPYRHRLLLKAFIPYAEAYVAVKDLNLDGKLPIPTTTMPCTTEEAEILLDVTDFPDDYYEEIEDNRDDSRYREDETLAEVEELKRGVTKVMDPNLCKYRKSKKMKWS
ncbi:MAM domain-containing protein [Nephila pilipes]|uniref:MAM domain-containing protein n=1 Tax=Nephila pilipes TaxID=299642 RepID=A0A8X6MVY5_NEPPI|nr:MAM domain-containing protein [Nephila pilipes]